MLVSAPPLLNARIRRAGFLQFPTEKADRKGKLDRAPGMVRRTIIVNTGPGKPDG